MRRRPSGVERIPRGVQGTRWIGIGTRPAPAQGWRAARPESGSAGGAVVKGSRRLLDVEARLALRFLRLAAAAGAALVVLAAACARL